MFFNFCYQYKSSCCAGVNKAILVSDGDEFGQLLKVENSWGQTGVIMVVERI
jgi:hypothetical protein